MTDHWTDHAACAGRDPALWFPELHTGMTPAQVDAAYAAGRAVCWGECPVRVACLQHALDAREDHGMWGGLTEVERRRMRSTGRCLACGAPTPKPARAARPLMYCGVACIRTASARRRRVSWRDDAGRAGAHDQRPRGTAPGVRVVRARLPLVGAGCLLRQHVPNGGVAGEGGMSILVGNTPMAVAANRANDVPLVSPKKGEPGDGIAPSPALAKDPQEVPGVTERNPSTIKALPTEYAGFTFRSRTEARWAVFLDALEVKWDYEPEAFEFGGQRYLPDFWLPQLDKWLEIKGLRPTLIEAERCTWLADGTGHPVLMFWNEPRMPDGTYTAETDQGHLFLSDGWDNAHWWCECRYCGFIDVQFNGRSERLRCRCIESRNPNANKEYAYDTPRLDGAYTAARTAFTGPTFHGQKTRRYDRPS